MADTKFSLLPLVTAGATDVVPVLQTGVPSRTTPTSIAALATKTTVGLPNVDNTSDANKPISTATQTALDGKQATGNYATGGGTATGTNTGDQTAIPNATLATMLTKTYKGNTTAGTAVPTDVPVATLKTDLVLVKADVGLGSVDNTADTAKPVSTAQQTALNLKVNNTGDETVAGVKTFSSNIVGSIQILAGTLMAEAIVPVLSAILPTNYVATRSSKYEITGVLSLELQGTSILAIL